MTDVRTLVEIVNAAALAELTSSATPIYAGSVTSSYARRVFRGGTHKLPGATRSKAPKTTPRFLGLPALRAISALNLGSMFLMASKKGRIPHMGIPVVATFKIAPWRC